MKTFTVNCVAEIDNHIGTSTALIVGDSPTDWYIDCVTNKYDGELAGEFVSLGLYEEIEAEIVAYFANLEAKTTNLKETRNV